uniref:Sulfhydryl oxidase n=1 Tax=Eptatretus burgeri TaxID=7764 RepID=A0A8C4N6M5_EPTBU
MAPSPSLSVPKSRIALLTAIVTALSVSSFPLPCGASLYHADDMIVILEPSSISEKLNHSQGMWMVVFYASWCGHCIDFAVTWKALALDVKDWRPLVNLAAMDCADKANRQICRDYNVRQYPSLRVCSVFPSTKTTFNGDGCLAYGSHYLELDIEDFFAHHPEHYLALVFEAAGSYVGREVMLDLMHYKGITVRRSLGNNTALTRRFNVVSLPTVVVLDRNGSSFQIQPYALNRPFFHPLFLSRLEFLKVAFWALFFFWFLSMISPTLWKILYISLLMTPPSAVPSVIPQTGKHQLLLGFVKTCGHLLISFLCLWSYPQIPNTYFPTEVKFVGCQGSKPNLRGYPCSLWILFHTLTVHAASRHDALVALGEDVLVAMRAYVSEFFGCHECAVHFKQMAKSLFAVRSWDAAVLWLWRSHNKVNLRIAGSVSEDPQFPKIQWPPPEICQACHIQHGSEHQWNISAVLNFLKYHYREENISPQYLPILPTEVESEVGHKRRVGRENVHTATHLRLWRRRRQERDLNVAKISSLQSH